MSAYAFLRTRRIRLAAVTVACAAVVSTVSSALDATEQDGGPGRTAYSGGVEAETLAEGKDADGLRIRAQGPTEVAYRRITIKPGGSTGWHYHPGRLLAVVKSGTLTRTLADCSVEVSGPGDTVLEPVGRRHAHIGRNLGSEPVVLYATYFMPEGSAHSVTAEDPGCD